MRHRVSHPRQLITFQQLRTSRTNASIHPPRAALCQVFDSIFLDLPMHRVKFNANTDYQYVQNFKILQSQSPHARLLSEQRPPPSLSAPAQVHTSRAMNLSNHVCLASPDCFAKYKVDKPIPVEALVKCKMQDNLEFLQWAKRYWDQHYPGGDYDAPSRRKGAAAMPSTGSAPRVATSATGARRGGTTPTTGPRVGRVGAAAAGGGAASAALLSENATLKETVVGLERERDFYFSKLRDIELLVQQAVEEDPELEKQEDGLIKHIQTILYSTEEGFEIPAEGEALDDQETF